MTVAKGLTSGYSPMGAVIAAPSVWREFYRQGAGVFRHGFTYGGHATSAAAGLANIDMALLIAFGASAVAFVGVSLATRPPTR